MVSIIRDLLREIIAALPPRKALEMSGASAWHGSGAGLRGGSAGKWDVLGAEKLIKTSD